MSRNTYQKWQHHLSARTDWLAHQSRRLRRWAYSVARIHRMSTLSNKNISMTSWPITQILSVASLGWRKDCIRLWGRSDQNIGYHGNRKLPLTCNGKNVVSTFSQSPLIGSLSNLLITRTGIKCRMSTNLGCVRLFTSYLPLSVSIDFGWEKWCLHLFLVTMNSVSIKLTGNEDRHKISAEFEFGSYLPSHFGVTCPWEVKKTDVSNFSQSPLTGSLSNLHVTRTGIKARTSSNWGRIGLFTLEFFTLERRFFPHSLIMGKR